MTPDPTPTRTAPPVPGPATTVPAYGPPSSPFEQPGRRYELLTEIARGGMGEVYRAVDHVLGREVAVKVLLAKFEPESAAARRFVEEARIAGQLQHPGIPAVHDLGVLPDGRPFLAMKLINGHTLGEKLAKDRGRIDREWFVGVFEQVCLAVAYAHSKGVVHRDLKPANVMIGDFDAVQVMDWGVAKVMRNAEFGMRNDDPSSIPHSAFRIPHSEPTLAGSLIGTPAFMPPEQAGGEIDKIDERADVFGLGAVLAVILTGHPPYVGSDGEAVRLMAVRGRLADCLARLDACGAEPDLVALCKACLAFDPADRPRDAAAVAQAVARHRVTAADRARRAELDKTRAELTVAEWRKRRRVLVALAAAVVALCGLGGAWAWRVDRQAALDRTALTAVLDQADAALREGKLADADAALTRAGERAAAAPADLRDRYESLRTALRTADDARRRDARMAARLDEARLAFGGARGALFDRSAADPLYRRAFAEYGLNVEARDPDPAAAVAASPLADRLVTALDDWAIVRESSRLPGWRTLLGVARAADPDPWRDRLRDAYLRDDRATLVRLARDPEVLAQPAATLALLGRALSADREDKAAAAVLRHAQRREPGNFWINANLGSALIKSTPADAAGFLRAAVVLRPDSAEARANLAYALTQIGDLAEAEFELREAIRLRPDYAMAHSNLGTVVSRRAGPAAAVPHYLDAIRADPNFSAPYNNLGRFYRGQFRLWEAEAVYREAVRRDPYSPFSQYGLIRTLWTQGRFVAAEVEARRFIAAQPNDPNPHSWLAVCLLARLRIPEAARALADAVRLVGPRFRPQVLGLTLPWAVKPPDRRAKPPRRETAPPPRPARP